MADSPRSLLVLGLGNILCADDGLGVRAVEAIVKRYEVPEGARVLDGGTLGLTLLSYFEGADDVVLVDAVASEDPAGTLIRLVDDDVAPAVRNRLSCHQVGVTDLLDALRLLDSYPDRIVLWGMVPESLELNMSLSPAVQAGLEALIKRVVEETARLGYRFRAKKSGEIDESPVAHNRLSAALPLGV